MQTWFILFVCVCVCYFLSMYALLTKAIQSLLAKWNNSKNKSNGYWCRMNQQWNESIENDNHTPIGLIDLFVRNVFDTMLRFRLTAVQIEHIAQWFHRRFSEWISPLFVRDVGFFFFLKCHCVMIFAIIFVVSNSL